MVLGASGGNLDTNGNDVTFANGLTGVGGFTKAGAGTLTLAGTNTYAGATIISAGTLQVGAGGTTGSLTGDVTDNTSLVFDRSNDSIYAGDISGTGSLVKQGAGVLTLFGANTYAGGTTVEAGTLRAGAAGAFVANSVWTLNGGTLDLNGYNLTASSLAGTGGAVDLGSATLTVDQATGVDTTVAGTITGAGSLAKQGDGTLTLTGANGYTGGTTVTAGTLQLGTGGSLAATGALTVNGGTFDLNGHNQTVGALDLGANGTIALGTNTLTTNTTGDSMLSGTLTGTGSLIKQGTGTLTLDDGMSLGGPVNVDGGALAINGTVSGTAATIGEATYSSGQVTIGSGETWTNSGALVVGGAGAGTLNIQAGGAVSSVGLAQVGAFQGGGGTVTVSGAGAVWTNAGNLVVGASSDGMLTVSGGGAVTLDGGAGTLTLANSYGTQGTLNIGTGGAAGTLSAASVYGSVGHAKVQFSHTDNISFAPNLTGALSLFKTGAGALTLTGANTYTGGTTVDAGTLRAGAAGALPDHTTVEMRDGSTLDLNNFDFTASWLADNAYPNATVTLGSATLTIDQTSSSYYFVGKITGTGGFVKQGAGTLTLSGANAYTGGTTIEAGTLIANAAGTLPAAGAVTINGGTLQANAAGALPNNTAYTVNGGTLDLHNQNNDLTVTGFSGTGGAVALGGAYFTVNLAGDSSYSGAITGPGYFVKGGDGTLTLSGASHFTGYAFIVDGALDVAGTLDTGDTAADNAHIQVGYHGTGDAGSTGVLNIPSGGSATTYRAVLGVNAGDSGTMSLAGNFTTTDLTIGSAGTGEVTLTDGGALAVSGTLTLGEQSGGAGTLHFGDGGAAGTTTAATITGGAGGGAVDFNHTGSLTLAANLTGNLAVTQAGAGTTILTGDAAPAAGTTISAGTLQIGAGGTAGTIAGAITDNTHLAFDRSNDSSSAAAIGGDGDVTKTGAGTLTLSGASSFTGGLNINGGFVAFASSGNLGAGAVVLNGGGLRFATGNTTDISGRLAALGAAGANFDTNANDVTFATGLTGAGGLTKTGEGTLTLAGTSNYDGVTAVNGGALSVTGTLATAGLGVGRADNSTAVVTVAGAGATLTIANGSPSFVTVGDNTGSTGTLTVANGGLVTLADGAKLTVGWNGAGTLNLNAGGTVAIGATADGLQQGIGGTTVNLNGGTLRVAGGFTTSVPLILASTSTLEVTDGTAAVSGAFSGAGGLTKLGAGALTLSGTSAYTGVTAVNGGALDVTGDLTTGGFGIGRVTGATAAATVSGAGATLTIANGAPNFVTVGDSAGSTGTLTVADGGLVALPDGAKLTVGWNNATGTLNLNSGGTVAIGGTADGLQKSATATGSTVNLNGGTLRVGDGFTTTVPLTLAGTSTIEATGAATVSGALAGAGGLAKTGAGTLTLAAANTYSGATTITAGKLALGAGGTLANTSGIDLGTGTTFDVSAVSGYTVGAAQTLSGTGTIVGDVSVAGTLAPGHSPGLMTFAGDLTIDPGATLLFQLGGHDRGVSYDAVDVGGDLTYASAINFSLVNGFTPLVGDAFQLFDVTGASSGAFSSIQFDQPGWAGSFDYGTGTLTITASAVPEPATYALLAGLAVLAFACWRRRRRVA